MIMTSKSAPFYERMESTQTKTNISALLDTPCKFEWIVLYWFNIFKH